MKIVGIGASAGGLEAFSELVRALPTDTGLAFVLVQHLDPTHRSLLSELLGRATRLPVREIVDNTAAEPDNIYVIPPNTTLLIENGVLKLAPRSTTAGPARSIDHFLKSLAADQGANAIGVILSGAGSDGAKGIKAIKDAGGMTLAQDEASSKYDSMPRSAIATGCVDFVLPPAKIAAEISRMVQTPGRTRNRAQANARRRKERPAQPAVPAEGSFENWGTVPESPDLRRIFAMLRDKASIDFSPYRMNTIRRRLGRRLAVHKLDNLAAYLRILREDPAELQALYQDLLINVTSFFRNPKVFELLKKKVFPRIVKNHGDAEALRFWIAGCSTGQEAYSYAMAFAEYCETAQVHIPLQIFATDVNAAVLEKARSGRYTKGEIEGLSAARASRFMTPEGEGYRVQKQLRDMVVFAEQNLLTDPPFTRVNLISCRNMLIYIEPELQQKIIPSFHYALRPDGFLVLGTSESVGTFTTLFEPIEKTHKIYARKPGTSRSHLERPALPVAVRVGTAGASSAARVEGEAAAVDTFREADRLAAARYAPPAVLVSEEGEVLQFRGKVQPYLAIPNGRATLNVTKMARGGLMLPLQRALQRAKSENKVIRERAVTFDGPRHLINLEVIPIRGVRARCFLVHFEKSVGTARTAAVETRAPDGSSTPTERRQYTELRKEHGEMREHLEHLRDQHEAAVEELQASNEEVQSSNEELQSLNEELETSNEELESANEELTTLNEELGNRNTELRESEQRLREQAQLVELAPLLARSPKDRIIFWNRGAETLYGYTKEEAIGQTSHLLLATKFSEPLEKIQEKLAADGRWAGEVTHRRKDGTTLCIATQWVVYMDEQSKVRAILEVNTDISARRQAEESLRKAQQLNERILETSPDSIMVIDLTGRLVFVNAAARRAFDGNVQVGERWSAIWTGEARAAAESAYRAAMSGDAAHFQTTTVTPEGLTRWWEIVVQPIADDAENADQLLAVCRDVSERRQAELAIQEEARLAALRAEIAVEVSRGEELVPILQQVAQILAHHTSAANVRIWLLEGDSSILKLAASAGQYTHLSSQQAQLMVGEGRVGTIAANKRPHVTQQVVNDPEICDPEWARREGIVAFAGHPLVFESKLLGVVAVLSRQKFESRMVREFALCADAIALVVQRRQANEDRNRLLQQAMDARNAALEASRAKDGFLAALSHELRTPLNPVLLLASDGAEDPTIPAPIRATFETIRDNVSLEARLIDDLLDLTRIAHGKLGLDLKPMDVNAAVSDAVRIVASNAERQQLTFTLNLDAERATVQGDAVRLQQVFWNILNNAVKFTPHGGTIVVTTHNPAPDRIGIRIKDTGIGMRDGDLKKIFEAFSQVERGHGGLGLGLAIARQILEVHHGSIRALSDGPGRGSVFEIELPLLPVPASRNGHGPAPTIPSAATAAVAPSGSRPQADGGTRRLLLVEDHTATRSALRTLLGTRGFEVVTAATAAEALLHVDDGRYDLLISDLGLPDMDGYQLMSQIRARRPDLVGIALSGYGSEEDRTRSRAAGFRSHLTKPVSIDSIDKAIVEALNPPDENEDDGRAQAQA